MKPWAREALRGAARGATLAEIAAMVDVSPPSIRKYRRQNPDFAQEFESARKAGEAERARKAAERRERARFGEVLAERRERFLQLLSQGQPFELAADAVNSREFIIKHRWARRDLKFRQALESLAPDHLPQEQPKPRIPRERTGRTSEAIRARIQGQKSAIMRAAARGDSLEEVASKVNVCTHTLRKYCRENLDFAKEFDDARAEGMAVRKVRAESLWY